jgi:hypothetical protein
VSHLEVEAFHELMPVCALLDMEPLEFTAELRQTASG